MYKVESFYGFCFAYQMSNERGFDEQPYQCYLPIANETNSFAIACESCDCSVNNGSRCDFQYSIFRDHLLLSDGTDSFENVLGGKIVLIEFSIGTF